MRNATNNTLVQKPLNVHVLVDLERSANAGGHVKCWERFAQAAIKNPSANLTLHFSGTEERRTILAQHVTVFEHPAIFSTRRIPFLGHVPDHTDMGSYHPNLAKHLMNADVIHTTDAFFCFTKTAERIAKNTLTPLVHSVHTDSVAYAELFTRSMLEERFGSTGLGGFLNDTLNIPKRIAAGMQQKLENHQKQCAAVLTSREEDKRKAGMIVGNDKLHWLRLGLDKNCFNPERTNRNKVSQRFKIPNNALIVVFVGRLDEGKNIYTLIDALERVYREGIPVFLIAAGIGPATETIRARLHGHAVTPGFIPPHELAEIYASADYLAVPSLVETWSMVAAEALACGLPVIAAAESGVGRFIGENHAGEVVKDNTVQAWADALRRANKNRDDAIMRDNALVLSERHFPSWEQAYADDLLPVWHAAGKK